MKKEEAKDILSSIGMPEKQQSDICIYSLLALANIKENDNWSTATNEFIRIHDIIAFTAENFGVKYAENSRETFRKQAMHSFITATIIENNGKATNSPLYKYRLTTEFLNLIKSYTTDDWKINLSEYMKNHETLTNIYMSKKKMQRIPLVIDGQVFELSTGKHNLLQKSIIEDFAPRFAHNAEVLYIGDTKNKHLFENLKILSELIYFLLLNFHLSN